MGRRRILLIGAAAGWLAFAGAGCGDAPTTDDCCTAWLVNVVSDVGSGVSIRLDGESIYREATATLRVHEVEVYRSVLTGGHSVEFEVLAVDGDAATFSGRVLWQTRPGGAYSVKWLDDRVLHVGERFTVTVDQ